MNYLISATLAAHGMKIKVLDKMAEGEPMLLKNGDRLYALTDGENRIQSLTLEHKGKHTMVEIKNGNLYEALHRLVRTSKPL